MKKVLDGMNLVIKYFLILLMAVLVVAVFLQVVFRFAIEQPLAWTEELARYCLVWITFLGAAFAMATKSHIGVEVFMNQVPLRARKVLYIVAVIVTMAFFLLMIIQGYSLAMSNLSQLSPVLRIPMGVIYGVIPLSGLILAINLAVQVPGELKKGDA